VKKCEQKRGLFSFLFRCVHWCGKRGLAFRQMEVKKTSEREKKQGGAVGMHMQLVDEACRTRRKGALGRGFEAKVIAEEYMGVLGAFCCKRDGIFVNEMHELIK
jgi:hypothetical protein